MPSPRGGVSDDRPRHCAGAFAFATDETAMDDNAAAHAPPLAPLIEGTTRHHGGIQSGRSATLQQLEQLALRELSGAMPLPGTEHAADPLLACLSWDLDSPAL
jgi:hypothetical protein